MTFTEAALEVLRSAGEPLHYKRITELAIEKNLLSHVGKTPEVTMSSRLAMMVKKDRGQAPIIKVKPGVFAIREEALQDFAAAVAAAAAMEAETASPDEAATEAAPVLSAKPPALPGADVFPEEEGDDDPILAGLEQETGDTDKSGRRRRRRRRRGKGGDAPLEGAPRVNGSNGNGNGNHDAPRNEAPRGDAAHAPRSDRDNARDGRDARDFARGDRDRGRDNSRDGRDGGRDNNRDRGRDPRDARDSRVEEAPALDWNRAPGDGDLLGKDLADAVWVVLSRGERVPHGFPRIAELLVRRGRLTGNALALSPTIAAAVRADIARAEQARACPRFRVRSGRVLLTDWQQSKQLARAEQDLLNAADRYGGELRRGLIYKLSELPAAGFAELVATWLNAEGVTALRAVRRPESASTEFHFAGTRKRGSEETRLAIVVIRGSRDISRENVIDVRGGLHHYGQATNAWLITTGRVTAGAREEAGMQGAASVSLFDGMALATAMERLGVAVRSYVITHTQIDFELLEAIGDTPEQRERREREERERDARFSRESNRDNARDSRPNDPERSEQVTVSAQEEAAAEQEIADELGPEGEGEDASDAEAQDEANEWRDEVASPKLLDADDSDDDDDEDASEESSPEGGDADSDEGDDDDEAEDGDEDADD